jgi:hypothetical protein
VGLQRVWIETLDHGLVRADHVVEVLAHKTAPFAGKPAHWLLDVVTATNQGAGSAQAWTLTSSHRTLIQTDRAPHGAAGQLVALLAALHTADTAGIVTARLGTDDPAVPGSATIDFRFQLFPPAPDALSPTPTGPSPAPPRASADAPSTPER